MRPIQVLIVFVFGVTLTVAASEPERLSVGENLLTGPSYLLARSKKNKQKRKKGIKKYRKKKRKVQRRTRGNKELIAALNLIKEEKFEEASQILFRISHSPKYRSKKMQIKYILGQVLQNLNFYQGAAFNFIGVIKKGKGRYVSQSIEKLSLAADILEDSTLLNYAIKKVKLSNFPKKYRDILFYRIGEQQLRNKDFLGAVRSFKRVRRGSSWFGKALYNRGLALAELKQNKKALDVFDNLIISREDQGVTDSLRVAGMMGKARIYYQAKKWESAISVYRQIPRDTTAWHDTLFESSWAMLRSGKFRSALSNFQSIHSTFYESRYYPESLLVRSIVYLYICKYDEMDKVLTIFNKIYKPVFRNLKNYLNSKPQPEAVFAEAVRAILELKTIGEPETVNYKVPYIALRQAIRSGDFQKNYKYIKNLLKEKRKWQEMSSDWQRSSVGKYVHRVLERRLRKARKKAGRTLIFALRHIKADLFDLFEQEAFIRYEMTNGKKEFLKKRVADGDVSSGTVDEDNSRDYFIQNGYDYWKFQGEYWLDEIGNYHYVGKQSCE